MLILLLSFDGIAQNTGINYKALIKDNNGNVVANTSITIQFTVLQGLVETNVYQETHSTTTDENGIVIINIGEGTPISGTFSAIDWSSDDHFLNVKIDIEQDNSFVDMGTTQFKAVPYAIQAAYADSSVFSTTNNVTSNVPGNIELDDFVFGSASIVNDPFTSIDNSRMYFDKSKSTFRAGYTDSNNWNVENAGDYSFATGYNTTASGGASVAVGELTMATGLTATSIGYSTIASGESSLAGGSGTTASGTRSTTFGFNTIANDNNAMAIGNGTTASGQNSVATGISTIANGWNAFTTGFETSASGNHSAAMGSYTNAHSLDGLSIGRYNVGGGNFQTWVSSDPLFEIGNGTGNITRSNAFTVLKNGNIGIGTATPNNKLQITNGTDVSVTNALGFLVLGNSNGLNVGFDNNEIQARNNNAPSTLYLQNEGYNEATLNDNSGLMVLGNESVQNLVFDNNEIQARTNGVATTLYLQQQGGDVAVNSNIVHTSDRRLKKDIIPLNYGLTDILKLNPVSYHWKDKPNQTQKSIGLIAQELQEVISEVVSVEGKDQKTLYVNYTELIPVLIKAIQEQQIIINQQDSKIETLSAELVQVKTIDQRLKQLEALIKIEN
jgi:hypothetical protein